MTAPVRDVRQDRRATLWVAGVTAFVASIVLDHFLPLAGSGLRRVLLMALGGTVALYFTLRPWAARVAEWSDRRPPPTGP